jgi:glycosyltransferase involved in cell wall biosynthesis
MLYIGAVDQRNGTLFFIEIAKLLKEYRNRFIFHIIGTGSSLPILQSMVDQYNISENFIFYKNLSIQEIMNISKKIDLALAPYEFNMNSFSVYADPGKLVLYSALGLPVIVNRVPLMVKEYEDQAGFIGMNEDDDSEVWAKKIIELKLDSDLSSKLAQMSKNYGEKRKSEYVYSKLLARLIEYDR